MAALGYVFGHLLTVQRLLIRSLVLHVFCFTLLAADFVAGRFHKCLSCCLTALCGMS